MPSSEPKPNFTSESEPKHTVPTSETIPRPEPLPEWEVAIRTWKELWKVHFIGFGCLFGIMALFSCYCLYRIHRARKSMTLAKYFFAVCLMMMLFCFSRSLYLLLDPYESHSNGLTLPVILVRILFALGYPCLTSAFSLIHLAFIEVKKVRAIATRLQNIKFLTLVITLHFLIVIIVYTVVTVAPKLARLLILCQSILISWWIFLAVCFLYSGGQICWKSKITKQFFEKQRKRRGECSTNDKTQRYEAVKLSENAKTQKNQTNTEAKQSTTGVSKIVKIAGIVSILGLLSAAVELYSLFAVYKLYSLSTTFVDAWPWWIYVTCARLIEVLLCIVVAYVIFPSLKIKTKREKTSTSNSTYTTRNAAVNRHSKHSMETLGTDFAKSDNSDSVRIDSIA